MNNKIIQLENDLNKASEYRQQCIIMRDVLREQIKEIDTEISKYNIKPSEAKKEIEQIDLKMNELIKEIESNIPYDLIKQANFKETQKDNSSVPF